MNEEITQNAATVSDENAAENTNSQQSEENTQENTNSQSDTQNGNDNNSGLEDEEKDSEIYGSPENYDYSKITLPEGMELDKELVDEFNPLAKEMNLSNGSANKLMSLAVKLAEKNSASFKEAMQQAQVAEKNSYLQMLDNDNELKALSSDDYNKYVDVASKGYNAVATKEFKAFLNDKGLTHHPEFIKVFHKIGQMCIDSKIPDAKIPPSAEKSAADILYGNSANNEE